MSGIAQHPGPSKPVTISFDHESESNKDPMISEKTSPGKPATLVDADALQSGDWVECKKENRGTGTKRPREIPTFGKPVKRHFDSDSDPSNETEHCEEHSSSFFSELTQKIEGYREKRMEARKLGRAGKKKDGAHKTEVHPPRAKTTCSSSHVRRNYCGGLDKGRSIRFDSSDTEDSE